MRKKKICQEKFHLMYSLKVVFLPTEENKTPVRATICKYFHLGTCLCCLCTTLLRSTSSYLISLQHFLIFKFHTKKQNYMNNNKEVQSRLCLTYDGTMHTGLRSPKRFTNFPKITTQSGLYFLTSAQIVSPRVKKGEHVKNTEF